MSKRTRTEGVCELEMTRVRKNGERFPVLTTVTAIMDPSGKSSGFVEIIRDITVRKTLERQLRETKEFLEHIMESSVDGILTTDLKGKLTYVNRSMEEMLIFQGGSPWDPHLEVLRARHARGQGGHGAAEGRKGPKITRWK